jgi:hypothetical protein
VWVVETELDKRSSKKAIVSCNKNGELLTYFDKVELSFSLFPFVEKLVLLFTLLCLPVCKLD